MEKINVAELLKDCPKGMELDCAIYENVELDYIEQNPESTYPIHCLMKTNCGYNTMVFTANGCNDRHPNAKCVIFPKGKSTWEGFQRPFKDGDVVATLKGNQIFIFKEDAVNVGNSFNGLCYFGYDIQYNKLFKERRLCFNRLATEEEKQKLFDAIKANGYKWNPETKTLEKLIKPWSIQDAKDGDVICYDDGWTCIFKCIHGIWFSSYCFITDDGEFHTNYERHAVDSVINGNAHPATKEQCNRLFQKIKEAGYKWNAETKTLEKLIKPKFKVGDRIRHKKYPSETCSIVSLHKTKYDVGHMRFIDFVSQDYWELIPNKFDITTLKPFESRVLVRDYNTHIWEPVFWGKLLDEENPNLRYLTTNGCFKYCIPYEGNQHLLGTTNNCDDYYKTWE